MPKHKQRLREIVIAGSFTVLTAVVVVVICLNQRSQALRQYELVPRNDFHNIRGPDNILYALESFATWKEEYDFDWREDDEYVEIVSNLGLEWEETRDRGLVFYYEGDREFNERSASGFLDKYGNAVIVRDRTLYYVHLDSKRGTNPSEQNGPD